MKKKIAPAVVLFVLLSIASVGVAYNLDCLFQLELDRCTISPTVIWAGLWATSEVQQLALMIWLLGCLGLAWLLFGQSYLNYKSDMIQVTPELTIPASEGQGQYGSAKFLAKDQYSRYWSVIEIDKTADRIHQLMQEGRDEKATIIND